MTAVAPVVINGNGVWVGWPGVHMEDPNEPIPESDPNDRTPTAGLLSRKVSTLNMKKVKPYVYVQTTRDQMVEFISGVYCKRSCGSLSKLSIFMGNHTLIHALSGDIRRSDRKWINFKFEENIKYVRL